MGAKTVVSVIKNLFEQTKGYYLVSSFLAINLIVLFLSPQNWFAWGFFCLQIVRLVAFKNQSILLVTTFLLCVTFVFVFYQKNSNQTNLDEKMIAAEFYLNPEDYKIDGNLLSGTAELKTDHSAEKVAILYNIQSPEEKKFWEELSELIYFEAAVELSRPEGARNEHQFDYQDYLYRNRIHWTAIVEKVDSYEKDLRPKTILTRVRLSYVNFLKGRLPAGKTTDYLLAILFNQTKDIDQHTMESYRKIGVIHLFSISGMHIHFLIAGLRYLLLRIGVTHERVQPLLLLSIFSYGILIGSGVGIFRAISTNCMLLLATIFHRDIHPKDAFAWTILLALWLNPYLVFHLSFQLSYGLSGVLYFLSNRMADIKRPIFLKEIFLSFIMTSVSCLFLTYHYFEITWLGMFVNILFSFFFSVCFFPLFWLLTIFIFLRIPLLLYGFLITSLDWSLLYLEKLTDFLAEKNWLLMITGRQHILWYLMLAAGIIYFLISIEQNKQVKKSISILLLSFVLFYIAPYLDPDGKVIMLDVGQGDSFLFITPFHRKAILLDTGGRITFGNVAEWQQRNNQDTHAKNLVSSIKAQGVRKLDAVILTHSDVDHLGNFSYLAKELPISSVYFSKGMENTENFKKAVSDINPFDVKFYPLQAFDRIVLGDLAFEVLSPSERGDGSNDDSLVLLSQIGGLVWLFTGDLEEAGENSLVRRYPNLQVDVLKVGHHGSKTSTTERFFEQMAPKTAWISAGKNNSYGHPHLDIITRLEQDQVEIFRTDLQGSVHFIYRRAKNEIKIMVQ